MGAACGTRCRCSSAATPARSRSPCSAPRSAAARRSGTRQLLLVNLLTDMFPALAVAVAHPAAGAPARRRRARSPGTRSQAVLLAGPQRGFTDAVRRMVLVRGAATTAGATGAWAIGRLTGPLRPGRHDGAGRADRHPAGPDRLGRPAQPAGAGHRGAARSPCWSPSSRRPGVSRFFGCTPLDPLSWLVVLGWAAAGTATAEVVPALVERFRAG